MSDTLGDRNLTTAQLMDGGAQSAADRIAQAGNAIIAYDLEGENRKGFLLAMCAVLSKRVNEDQKFRNEFLTLMQKRKTTVPQPDGNAKKGSNPDKAKSINKYLYFLRTLFGKDVGDSWVPIRTFENWAGPLRYLVSIGHDEIADVLKAIDEAEFEKDSKTYRRVEALRRKDWENHPPEKRDTKDKATVATAPSEIPRAVDGVRPLASVVLPSGSIPLSEGDFGLLAVKLRNGKFDVLFGIPDKDDVVRVIQEGYKAQKNEIAKRPVMVDIGQVRFPPSSVELKQSEEA